MAFRPLRQLLAAGIVTLAACVPPETPAGAEMHMGTLSEGPFWTTCIDTSTGFVELTNFEWAQSVRASSGLRCSDAPLEARSRRSYAYSNPDRAAVKFWLGDSRIDILALRAPMFPDRDGPCSVQPDPSAFEATALTIEEAASSARFTRRQAEQLRARAQEVREIDPAQLTFSGSRGSHEDTEFYCSVLRNRAQ